MRNLLVFFSLSLVAACGSPSQPTVSNTNADNRPMRSEQMQNSTAHTTENQPPKTGANSDSAKHSAGGEAIDTARFDGVIVEAEKAVKAKPNDESAKTALADAYFDRGFALTQARQYASALGDYRRAVKYEPNHEEAKKWIVQIEGIYQMMKKEAPTEGKEPPPLPFKK